MKFKIIILRILFIISLIISVFFISDTFAKYQESINTNYKSNIKRWKMIVNDHVIRNGENIGSYTLESLKIKKDDVKEVGVNFECGIKLAGFNELEAGDILEVFELERIVF